MTNIVMPDGNFESAMIYKAKEMYLRWLRDKKVYYTEIISECGRERTITNYHSVSTGYMRQKYSFLGEWVRNERIDNGPAEIWYTNELRDVIPDEICRVNKIDVDEYLDREMFLYESDYIEELLERLDTVPLDFD